MIEVQEQVREATAIFELLKGSEVRLSQTSVKTRKRKLKALEREVLKRREDVKAALRRDFNRSEMDTDFVDVYPVLAASRNARANLKWWVQDRHVSTPLMLLGSSSWIKREAKGISLIISPWNYPLNLALCALVSAVAAGCPVILKPSEATPNLSKVMGEIIKAVFGSDEVALIEGDKHTARELLKLPFRHIFFTGSTEVGKAVMEAASQNLASVTLELGGKSPTVVGRSADIKKAALRIAITKMANAGQTCIAPDYILAHADVKAKLIEEIKIQLRKRFVGKDWSITYTGIINEQHASDLQSLIDDAHNKGAKVWQLECDIPDGYMKPTLVEIGGQRDLKLMEDENIRAYTSSARIHRRAPSSRNHR